MQPRLASSRQWTAFPKELITQVKSVFRQSFRDSIGEGVFDIDGRIYKEELLLRVAYKIPKSLKHSGFEISVGYVRDKDNVLKLIHLAIDAAASLFEQYFASEDDYDFPRKWESVDFENRQIFVQYSTTNKDLEEQADKLLGQATVEKLAQGDWDEDEGTPESIKAKLGVLDNEDDDDDDDDFGKRPKKH